MSANDRHVDTTQKETLKKASEPDPPKTVTDRDDPDFGRPLPQHPDAVLGDTGLEKDRNPNERPPVKR